MEQSIAELTRNIEHEADEPMMRRKRQQDLVNEDDMFEVVDDAFTVEKIHSNGEKVPVQALGEAKASRPTWDVRDGDDFLERNDLDRSANHDDVDVAGEQGPEEASYHDKSPYRARDESLLLLLVVRGLRWWWGL